MKKFFTLLLLLVLFTASIYSQNVGDYQSFQSGNWNDVNTWSRWDGNSWVNPAPSTPDSTQAVATTILSGHNVTVNASVGIGSLTVNSGGTLTLTCTSTTTLTIATFAVVTINGTFVINGLVNSVAPYNVVIKSSSPNTGVITVGNGGIIDLAASASSTTTKGFIPTATWQTGSTLVVDSLGGSGATGWGAGSSQHFYNINYQTTTSTGNFGWGFVNDTVGGNFNVTATGTGRLQVFGGSSGTLIINGNLNISGSSNFTITGTSTGGTYDTVNVNGNVNVNTTGNFSISRGSQGGTGTSIFNFAGNVSITAGTMQNSNTTPNGAKFRFVKNGSQSFKLVPSTVNGNALPIEVAIGSNVNLLSPVNVTTLYLNGGIITSSASNPLVMGWWSGSALTPGTVSSTAPGSYVNGPMSFLVAAIGATSKTYPIGKGGIYRPLTLSLSQSAATLSTYTAEMFNVAPTANNFPSTLDKVSTIRNYVISEGSGGSAFTAGAVTLSYDADDGVTDMANLRVAQGPAAGGGTWVDLGGTGSANTTGTILSTNAFTDLTTNTVFTLADNSGGSNVLPVELNSFSASINSVGVELTWSTATEVNNAGFEVQKMVNGSWTDLDFVSGDGNSNSAKSYSYIDKGALCGTYQYRLKQIDNDGTYKFSQVVEVNSLDQPLSYKIGNYPNPFNPATTIRFELPENTFVSISVYNMLGQKVATIVNQKMEKGIHEYSFNASSLASGVYIYQLNAGSKVLTQKMLLLK